MFLTFVAIRINCQWTLGSAVLEMTITNINKLVIEFGDYLTGSTCSYAIQKLLLFCSYFQEC